MLDAFSKLNPRQMVRNPVMFVVEVGSVMTTGLFALSLTGGGEAPAAFTGAIAVWLWFTVLFANFSEALAEGRGKAQAEALRRTRTQTPAKKIKGCGQIRTVRKNLKRSPPPLCAREMLFLAEAGDIIAADGEVVAGIASVDESAITGESAPVIREIGRRPQRRNRRDAGSLRLAGCAGQRKSRRGLFGPHDRPGGRR